MYCSNCGNQISETAKFCNHCGEKQPEPRSTPNSSANPYDAYTPPVYNAPKNSEYRSGVAQPSSRPRPTSQQGAPKTANHPRPSTEQKQHSQTSHSEKKADKKAPKNKKNIFITLAIVLCAYLIGHFVVAPSMLSDSDNTTTTKNPFDLSLTDAAAATPGNPAYNAIMQEAGIIHMSPLFITDSSSFVMKTAENVICLADYGYENDVVKKWVENMYVPVKDLTDDQKAQLESTMKEQFAICETLSCCEVEYEMLSNYYNITCTYDNVDSPEAMKELFNAGLSTVNEGYLSMELTEKTLLDQGFVKK